MWEYGNKDMTVWFVVMGIKYDGMGVWGPSMRLWEYGDQV